MLARPDEDDGGVGEGQRLDELVHGAGAAAAGEDDHVVLGRVDGAADQVTRLVPGREGGR